MEAKHPPENDAALPTKGGCSATQSVVDLIRVSHCGLVFWSRHPFEIASELQVRLCESAVREASPQFPFEARCGWVFLKGFVVDCQPARRADGTVGFQVSLLFPVTTKKQSLLKLGAQCRSGLLHGPN